MQIPSGYKTITPTQIANVVWLLHQGGITAHGLRVYLACFAAIAIREAAARSRKQRQKKPRDLCRYRWQELVKLTGLDAVDTRRAVRQLQAAQLITFREGGIEINREPLAGSEDWQGNLAGRRSPRRPIPVPRVLLRFLARQRSAVLIQVALAYLLRGLSITPRNGEITARGTIKASSIADTFALSLRAVKYAQAQWRAVGWVSKDTGSHQLKLNRDGAYFVLNLEWKAPNEGQDSTCAIEPPSGTAAGLIDSRQTLVHRGKSSPILALLPPENAPVSAPPRKDKETSYEDQHHETRTTEPCAGVFLEGEGHILPPTAPTLRNIRAEDLIQLRRLEQLHREAVAQGWIPGSEAMALNFIAAAARAREVGHDPVRVFVTLVRRGLWTHITQAQEDRARRALARIREEDPARFRPSDQPQIEVRNLWNHPGRKTRSEVNLSQFGGVWEGGCSPSADIVN